MVWTKDGGSGLAFSGIVIVFHMQVVFGIEFLKDSRAIEVDRKHRAELIELTRFLGNPDGNPINAKSVNGKDIFYTETKMDCYRIPTGTSDQRKALLMKMCPQLRDKEFNMHAGAVARILTATNTTTTFQQQKEQFVQEVLGMAKSAGQLPTLQFGNDAPDPST